MKRPNFVCILADDLGYADLGCTGARGESPVTPALDRLAAQGLLFHHGYANSAVCSPTRFALATGRWQYRLRGGAEEPMTGRARGDKIIGLDPAHPTLASLLRDAGYTTALSGKWHLGYPPHFGPLKSGYQHFFGPLSGGVDYFSHRDSKGTHDLWDGDDPADRTGYLTDLISEHAVGFVEAQNPSEPFLLSVHYTAPHWPWETRADADESSRIGSRIHHLDGGSIATYRQMVHEMDEGIAQLVAALQRRGFADDTLLFFTSDNGGERYSDNWPFVGQKMDLLEGGIRVPLIAHWPRRIRPSRTTRTPVVTMDLTATMLAAAGVAPHPRYPLDGFSMLPLFVDPSWSPDRSLYWRMKHRGQRAMRRGPWKYLRVDGTDFLFDLSRDERERANMARREPALLEELRQEWEQWNDAMPAIPEDASVSPVFGDTDLPRGTH